MRPGPESCLGTCQPHSLSAHQDVFLIRAPTGLQGRSHHCTHSGHTRCAFNSAPQDAGHHDLMLATSHKESVDNQDQDWLLGQVLNIRLSNGPSATATKWLTTDPAFPDSPGPHLEQPRCGTRGCGGAASWSQTYTTHTGRRRGPLGKDWYVMVRACTKLGNGALGSSEVVSTQRQNMENTRKTLGASGPSLWHQVWGVLKPLGAASDVGAAGGGGSFSKAAARNQLNPASALGVYVGGGLAQLCSRFLLHGHSGEAPG